MENISSIENIEMLITNKVEESISLDYKSDLGNNKDIAKDITAFANTLGGTLIYGVTEHDRSPMGIQWITIQKVEEKIQNIIRDSLMPPLNGITINRFTHGDTSKFIIVIQIPASSILHMTDHRYYKRQGSESVPMEDHEVKAAMFRMGIKSGLQLEIKENSILAKNTLELIEFIYSIPDPQKRGTIAFIPFHDDAWKSLLTSGLLNSLDEDLTSALMQTYAIIHETNSLIEWLKTDNLVDVRTPAYMSSVKSPTYVPAIVQNKVAKLLGLLNKLETSLSIN